MAKRKIPKNARQKASRQQLLHVMRELRQRLGEINQKLDHLIRHYRHYFITDDFAHSSEREFDG